MPVSRKRKKKKNKRGKKPGNKKRVINKDGIELVLDGKKVFINNKRTEDEHKKFLENLKTRRPEILKEVALKIEKALSIFEEYDKVKLLGALTYHQIENLRNPNGDEWWEVTLEYGLSIATATIANSTKEPPPGVINELIDLLISIREEYKAYLMTDHVAGKYSELESSLRFKTMVEALYVRGDGYRVHVDEIYLQLFAGHNAFLKKHYGFIAEDILETFEQLENSFFCRMAFPEGSPHPAAYSRFVEWLKETGKDPKDFYNPNSIKLFGEDNPDVIIVNGKVTASRLNDIDSYNTLFKVRTRTKTQEDVIKRVSIKLGENSDFLNPKFKALPLNHTLIFEKPIINIGGDYYHFSFSLPIRNLITITEALIKDADTEYYNQKYLGNSYSLSRDNFLEQKASELLNEMMADGKSYLNLKYKPGDLDPQGNLIETELDLLMITPRANYLVEMKAGGLTGSSRRGAIQSLTGQLEETIGFGAFQSYRAYKYIKENAAPKFYDYSGLEVIVDNSKETFRITVTLEHMAGFAAYLHDLKKLGVIESTVDFAWTTSIYDLMIFSEILENEEDFIAYLKKRIPLYERQQFHINDEIDLLGYFLEHDMEFDEKSVSKLHSFQLNKYSSDIDKYFEKDGDKPIRKQKGK